MSPGYSSSTPPPARLSAARAHFAPHSPVLPAHYPTMRLKGRGCCAPGRDEGGREEGRGPAPPPVRSPFVHQLRFSALQKAKVGVCVSVCERDERKRSPSSHPPSPPPVHPPFPALPSRECCASVLVRARLTGTVPGCVKDAQDRGLQQALCVCGGGGGVVLCVCAEVKGRDSLASYKQSTPPELIKTEQNRTY